jgi:hypothetical protein
MRIRQHNIIGPKPTDQQCRILRPARAKAHEHQTYADGRNKITLERVATHLLRITIGKDKK